jgi:hypothetical protein
MSEYEDAIQRLLRMIEIQKEHMNWDDSPYMRGLTNGMILALSIVDGSDNPKFMTSGSYMDECPDCKMYHGWNTVLSHMHGPQGKWEDK